MRQRISMVLLVAGVLLVSFSAYQIISQHWKTKQALLEAEAILANGIVEQQPDATGSPEPDPERKMLREDFAPELDEVIGILNIPKLEARIPIIEGTEEEMLARGVGHYTKTAFPTDGKQILLSGHRDTVFRAFGKLEIGDRFTVELPYGEYVYEMRESEIVDEDDRTVIRPMEEEVLTLSTCYPFRYVGNAPQRYIIYAHPVEVNTRD